VRLMCYCEPDKMGLGVLLAETIVEARTGVYRIDDLVALFAAVVAHEVQDDRLNVCILMAIIIPVHDNIWFNP